MDTSERLSLDSVNEHTAIACEHIHRYEFAAAICGGLRVLDLACGSGYGSAILAETALSVHGVDNDAATIDLAAATVGQRTIATFEVADAVGVLGEDLSERYDAIVCFEGLEHLNDIKAATSGLGAQAKMGVKLVVSVPNSRAFNEQNEFHVTDFGYDEAMALLNELPASLVVGQYLTEGSLIRVPEADELDARLINMERAELEYANHFLLIANFEAGDVSAVNRNRTQLAESPVHSRYMRNLEVANVELRRRNNELARKLLGGAASAEARAGSAAPSFVHRLNSRIEELEALEESQSRDIAARDAMLIENRRELLELRQQLAAPAGRVPTGLRRLARLLRR